MDSRSGKHCAKCDRPDTVDNLVGCDTCETWMHFGCAGVTDSIADPNRTWKCDRCRPQVESSVCHSSVGRSSASRRSSRIELSLRMLEEQKVIRMRILEEEAAQVAARKKIAEEEENFLKQKYALLLAEADGAEDGVSRRSGLSSRASREKVQSWLSGQEVGASQQVTVAQSSNISPSAVVPEAAQQSTIPASISVTAPATTTPRLATANTGNIPVIIAPTPTSTSTPNSTDDFGRTGPTDGSVIPELLDTGKFVSRKQIAIREPPVSTSLTQYDSPVGINSFISTRPTSAPLKNISAPPSISYPHQSFNVLPFESVSTSYNVPNTSRGTLGCGNNTVATSVGVGTIVVGNSTASNPFDSGNSYVPMPPLGQNQSGPSASSFAGVHPHPLQYPVSSIPIVSAVLTSACSSTWMNSNPISVGAGGDGVYGPTSAVPTQAAPMFVNSRRVPAGFNHPVPPPVSVAPTQDEMPNSADYSTPSVGQPQQRAATVRRGPSNEQLAARQVMPRELSNFSGDPQDWPLFYSSFCNSTEACGFSDSENLARLQRCLKGNALEAVKSRLLMPQSVPFVIDILRRLYGRPEVLIHSLLQKLRAVPSPKSDNLQSQITFGLAVQNVVDHMSIANLADHLWNPSLLHELVEKLPPQLKMQWSYHKSRCAYVNLAAFSAFMSEIVVMASDVTLPIDSLATSSKPSKIGKEKPKLYVHTEDQQERKSSSVNVGKQLKESANRTCLYCDKPSHEIADCMQFKALDIDGRWKAVKLKNLCRSCLVPHRRLPCRARKECGVDGCKTFHHKLLHSFASCPLGNTEVAEASQSTVDPKTVVHHNLHSSMTYSLFRYIPVTIHGNGQQVKTYAFLDDGSSSTLFESGIAKALGIHGPTDGFCLSWTGNISREEKESQRISIVISGEGKKFKLHNVRTVQALRLPRQTMCYDELQRSYHHLKGLPVRSYADAAPGIIIGIEHVRLLTSLRLREGKDNEPVATKTRLGWCIFGKSSDSSTVIEQLNLHLDGELGNRELHQWMKQFFAVEESSVTVKPEPKEDTRAREIMEATTQRVNGAFETGLLWRFDHIRFPDSYPMAVRRLNALEKRLSKDPILEAKVREQIADYEAKGYAHRITPEELQSTEPSRVWYLPLGVVQNPKKPAKVRLIWDAKARAGGVSFNDMLLKGPDLLVALMSVLLRFRQRNIAIVGDIKEMFHQIRIRDEDRQSQRFLFRPHSESPPQIYVMDVATFGATCSPSLAQFVKNENAKQFAETSPRAAKAVTDNHYVDDFLDSVDTEEEAVTLINEVKYIHSQAGFEIRNFCSNSTEVLEKIGERGAPQEISMNLDKSSESERVLGLVWKPAEDIFTFDLSCINEEIRTLVTSSTMPTKRQVLRTVMSLFDPLGLISHFVVHGKILMQQIWRSGTDWDEAIPEELHERWISWCQYMQRLQEVAVPRCFFRGADPSTIENVEAHLFVDASEVACAAVLYLRIVDNGETRCALVAAKTKVAPLKPLSVPRLELQSAMIGTRLLDSVLTSLDIQITKRYLWCDSSTVLCWLRSDSRRYHQFVAFRVGEILTTTIVDEWHYVPSRLNAADAATKWKDGPSFDLENPWYKAPEFLFRPPEQWPVEPSRKVETDIELRATFLFHSTILQPLIDVSRFSNWNRLLRTTATVLQAVRRFKGEKASKPNRLTQKDLYDAENLLWRQVQTETYPDEYAVLKRNLSEIDCPVSIPKSSPLYRLSPFIDETGVIRMNSRLSAAPAISVDAKYPIPLQKKHHVTYLVVDDYHRRFLHGNGETVCNEIRQRFWIPGLRNLVRQVSRQCMLCRVKKAVPQPPTMAPLPQARVTGCVRPFTHTGVDYFGPIQVKRGRSLEKRWVALFTCLAIRAVHVELVHSLSTQSCIMAIRRFVSRRGSPDVFYSDNGTNFVGASNLLSKQIQDIHEDCATTFTNSATRWDFNPPSAPHMGGSWERMVRSVKTAMTAIADHPHSPSDEVLQTVITEAESVVNSRPLTYIPLESSEQEALTPNHFLLYGTKGVNQPASSLNTVGSSLRDSWRLAQFLVDQFWRRWIREYLPTIARRTKWFESVKPLEPGDLVLVIDEGKRNGWLRGRIVDVTTAADGQVRRAVVQTNNGLVSRPAVKLALSGPSDIWTVRNYTGGGMLRNHWAYSLGS
ncbi:uncharacterized protein LOC109425711 [Aedes albopictus]|uniref:Uncharacterized protein n=1 Tax=Aedes albopictus TaxID=7160 RepID=A0ABM1ZDF7_AEDAL